MWTLARIQQSLLLRARHAPVRQHRCADRPATIFFAHAQSQQSIGRDRTGKLRPTNTATVTRPPDLKRQRSAAVAVAIIIVGVLMVVAVGVLVFVPIYRKQLFDKTARTLPHHT